ncbi:putative membrane protein YdbT with pleckstrin-like domain [Cupriavidus metallidurans]|jgi:uncharacterized membrane protein YdbT with pleckstrin-like domain|uniref:PH domain-containing protein n=1 Tax=Cupriavidus TaxID=106589 RepID=UPI0007929D9B|nr:PH domain-containing protein [Cupriavidus metallidurans]KWW35394.1 hypothetical protein AU374_03461 [Cupriavidus metallidurans]MDE4921536.1 PH domain-containing protein [Cupriavidus metallidurans]
MSNEALLWSGRPSQAANLPVFVLCVVMCFIPFLIPAAVIIAALSYLRIQTTRIEVTTKRVTVRSGIMSMKLDEVELSLVRDIQLTQPLLLWLLKLANIAIVSSNGASPDIHLHGIPNAYVLREKIRRCVENHRDSKGVRNSESRHLVAHA